MRPNVGHAKVGAIVRIPDGRTGRLTFCPPPSGKGARKRSNGRSAGTQARVLMPSGAFLSFPLERLEVV